MMTFFNKITIVTMLLSISGAYSQNAIDIDLAKSYAVKNNTKLKQDSLEIEAAKEIKKSAQTNYFPKITANVVGMYAVDPLVNITIPEVNLPVYNGNPANLPTASEFAYFPGMDIEMFQKMAIGAINILQPIYAGGRVRTGNQLAQLNIDAKKQKIILTQKEVEIEVENQYWQLVSLQEKEKTVLKYEELLSEVHKQVSDAYKSGLIIKNDILKVELKKSELELNKKKLQGGKQLAIKQFCHTIGIPYDSTLVLMDGFKTIDNPSSYYVESDEATKDRIEYSLLEKSVEASKMQVKMEQGEYMPQFAVGLNGFYYHSLEKNTDATENGMAFATISIPISDWWGGANKLKEKRLQTKIAENNFEDTKSLLKLQIDKYWFDLTQAYEQIKIMEKSKLQAEENRKVSKDLYQQGISTLSEYLEAQAFLSEIENKLIEAKSEYKKSLTQYKQVTESK